MTFHDLLTRPLSRVAPSIPQTFDVLPPSSGQLLQVLSLGSAGDGSRMQSQTKFQMDMRTQEMHSPAAEGVHATSPLQQERHGGVGAANLTDLLSSLGVRFIG